MTAKQLPDDTYLDKIYTMLAQIEQEEGAAMDAAARAAYASIDGGGLLHVFSTGHSHMIVEEMFYRSGGLVPVNPILSDELMLHTGAITSTHMERMPGKAARGAGQGQGAARGRHDPHFLQYGHQHGAGGSGFVRKGTGADGGVRYLEEKYPARLPPARGGKAPV